jgi:hypothetical protein
MSRAGVYASVAKTILNPVLAYVRRGGRLV